MDGDNPGGVELVRTTSRRSECGRETLTEVQKWSGNPPGGPEVVGEPPGGVEVVGTTSQRSGSSRENLTEVWNW